MRVGTKSVLFGVHAFWIHPILVGLSWQKIYKVWPGWPEWVAIFLHDNYWGLPNIDGVEGKQHPARNAKLAQWLGGRYAEELVRFHSRAFASAAERNPSSLCAPDKYSILLEPEWFYLLRARLSGEIKEFVNNAIETEALPVGSADREWLQQYKNSIMKEFADVKYIPLTQGLYAKVDADAPEEIWGVKWYASERKSGKCYACAYAGRGAKHRYLHCAVMGGPPSGMEIDHINGDSLDNRRENLRFCTRAQNQCNLRKRSSATSSKHKGVSKDRRRGKWEAQIRLGGKKKHLGYFEQEIDAARAYNAAARELFGEFARLNNI